MEGIFTKIDHILGHKTYLNLLKRIENIQCLLSDHNGIKLDQLTERQLENHKIRGDLTTHSKKHRGQRRSLKRVLKNFK